MILEIPVDKVASQHCDDELESWDIISCMKSGKYSIRKLSVSCIGL
jgi:hypothetical protein